MRGFDNLFAIRLRAEASFVAEGTFAGRLYRVVWYPAAIHEADGGQEVHGEIYKMTNPTTLLAALDQYEEITEEEKTSLYLRREVPVTTTNGRVLSCQVYLYNRPTVDLSLIEGGKFTS